MTPEAAGKVPPPELRPCSDADREWAYALKSEAYREVVERQFGPWNEEFQRSLFAARWKPEKSKTIVIDGAPVGLIATEERDEEWWLDELQIVRDWRDRGLGRAIILGLLAKANAAGKSLRLQVLRENHRAEALYRRLGFKIVSENETHKQMEFRCIARPTPG